MAKLLILEKDPVDAWDLQGELVLGGRHDVTVEEDPKRALRRVHEEQFDLIIADWARVDGGWFCERLRQHRLVRHIPVILTGPSPEVSDPEAIEHLLRTRFGCHDFLLKPIDPERLCSLVDLYVCVGRVKSRSGESSQDTDDNSGRA